MKLPDLPAGYSWNARELKHYGEFYLNHSPTNNEPPEETPGGYCVAQFGHDDGVLMYATLGKHSNTTGLGKEEFVERQMPVEDFEELVVRLVALDRLT